jgi:hypothetical protein
MQLISHSTPRWIAVPAVLAMSLIAVSSILSIFYFVLCPYLDSNISLKSWIIVSTITGTILASMILRDHSRQARAARDSIPINGFCQHFGSFVYFPRANFWRASEVKTPIGSVVVKGWDKQPSPEHVAIWIDIAPKLFSLSETAFSILFSPEPGRFKQFGFKLIPTEIFLYRPIDGCRIDFSIIGIPSNLSLKASALFSNEMNFKEFYWNTDEP